MRVLDTSIIYKWFVKEEDTSKALSLLDDYIERKIQIVIPDLLFHELANALRYNPKIERGEVEEMIDDLFELDLQVIMTTPILIKSALKFSYEYQISVYDSLYLALAQSLEFEFITADRRLYEKTKRLWFVKYLGDIELGGVV